MMHEGTIQTRQSSGEHQKSEHLIQQQLYQRIAVRIPPQKKSVNIDNTHSVHAGAISNGESGLL